MRPLKFGEVKSELARARAMVQMVPVSPATGLTAQPVNSGGRCTELYLAGAPTQFSATFTPKSADDKSASLSQGQNTQEIPQP